MNSWRRERRADLGLLYLPPAHTAAGAGPDLDVAVVRRETLVAVLPAGLAAEFGDRVDLARLADREFLVPAPAGVGALAAHLVGACQLSGFEPRRHEVQLMQTVIALVGAGVGVSVLPAAARELCGPYARALPLARHVPVVEVGLVRRRSDAPTPPARRFLRLALDTPEPDVLGPAFARHDR
jgi:DNA-binding transcriptional LysR family regulator